MDVDVCPLPSAIADIMAQATTGCLSPQDRYGLKAILLQPCLTEEESRAVDRLLYGIRRGWLTLE